MGAAMMLAISTMFVLLLATRPWLCRVLVMDGPAFTNLFQGSTRWHTFIALALIPIYFGNEAIALGGLSAAAMIPLLNVVNVAVLAHYATGRRPTAKDVALSVVVLSSVGGVLFKFTGLSLPDLGYTVLDMIGRGSLGLALLAVGAGLRLDQAVAAKRPVIAATMLKQLLMPVRRLVVADGGYRPGRHHCHSLRIGTDRVGRLHPCQADGRRRALGRQYPHPAGPLRGHHYPANHDPGRVVTHRQTQPLAVSAKRP